MRFPIGSSVNPEYYMLHKSSKTQKGISFVITAATVDYVHYYWLDNPGVIMFDVSIKYR
jgi:hypothetical protein